MACNKTNKTVSTTMLSLLPYILSKSQKKYRFYYIQQFLMPIICELQINDSPNPINLSYFPCKIHLMLIHNKSTGDVNVDFNDYTITS